MLDTSAMEAFDYHHAMLEDEERTNSYLNAILQTVRAGDAVLDLGCGTGALSLFACLAGARRVYAVEREPVVELARAVVAANGYSDRVEFFHAASTAVRLPEIVDVIVTETIGSLAFDEGIVGWVADARDRLLTNGGTIVPRAVALEVALVETWEDYGDVDRWSRSLHGLDFSPLRSLALHNPLWARLPPSAVVSDQDTVADVDLGKAQQADFEASVRLRARRDAVAHGLGCWFSADLAPGIVLSTRPPTPVTSWDQALLSFTSPLRLNRGESVGVELGCAGNGRDWRWRIEGHPWQSTTLGRLQTPTRG